MKMMKPKSVELSLPNVVGYERIAMGCSETFAKNVGFNSERIEDLKTAVAEACLNAMKHGNKDNRDARVVVVMNYVEDTFQVEVWDKGEGIENFPGDPDIEKLIADLEPMTGFGLFLIKKLVDKVEFEKIDSQGHVVKMMVKKK